MYNRTLTALSGLILLGVVAGAHGASAQDAAAQTPSTKTPSGQTPPATTAPATPDAAKTDTAPSTTTVTVTGVKQPNKIDRQVYDNTKDIDSASGTAADALNKVPSVNVDVDGKVSLRGNSNVQVLVDGKPSAMMSGDNRAGALQSMSSGDISSVEVMTNPGAAFGSEGTGGIINLVMKKNRRPGKSGAIIVNVGDGRYNGSLTGSYNKGKLTLSGGLNYRHDVRLSRSSSTLQALDTSGNVTSDTEQSGLSTNKFNNFSTNGGIDYNLSDNDSIGAQINYSKRDLNSESTGSYARVSASGNSAYTRTSQTTGPHEDAMLDLNWTHTGDTPNESLKTDLRVARSDGYALTDSLNTYTMPSSATASDSKHQANDLYDSVFSLDYNRMVGQDTLTAGIQITHDDNAFNNTATGAGAAGLTSDFTYQQTLSAAYITYQKNLGEKWIVQGGLRAEALDLDTLEALSNTASHTKYTKVSPSAFATYTLSPTAKLRFSYSHRLQRPGAQDLNPFKVYVDPQNVSTGNPDLRPAETDSFEAGYEYSKGPTSYQVRAYYRKNDHAITSYSYFLSPDVLLTTKQNYGAGDASGLEVNYNGKLTKKLSLAANANLVYTTLTTPQIVGTQRATTVSGRISFDYAATLKDRFQFMYFSSGKQLTGQGYRSPFMMGNLSYRHVITPKASLIVTVNDPFKTAKFKTVTNTDNVYSEQTRSLQGPTVMIGLSYTLGGASADVNPWDGQRGGPGGGYRGPGGPGMGM